MGGTVTDLIERSEVGPADGRSRASASPRRGARRIMARSSTKILLFVLLLVAGALTAIVVTTSGTARHAAQAVRTVTLVSRSYRPEATSGTDDYHCTLLNPHVTKNSYVISSQFHAGSPEVHHAVLSLVPPSLASTALTDNANTGGKGWTCFGAPALPGASLAQFLNTPFLSVWAPGHGADSLPKDTGIELPAGSLVIMQVHYNLLVGDKPVKNSLVLDTVPTTTPLLPLNLDLSLAPPELPCPAGVTGPLCNRDASLADQARRFGPDAVGMVDGIEAVCGHDPSNPPVGNTASCTWPIAKSGYIVRAQAHMHLLGRSFTMVLNPGTPQARTVLEVGNYNFHYQKAYNLSVPIRVAAGDKLQVNCTYDPQLAQELPILRRAPAHFVTWGDGSSDEMCIGLAWTSASLPDSHDSL
jgi:Copper type II ascorbate-dependent monooxygenase, C-terminal domain